MPGSLKSVDPPLDSVYHVSRSRVRPMANRQLGMGNAHRDLSERVPQLAYPCYPLSHIRRRGVCRLNRLPCQPEKQGESLIDLARQLLDLFSHATKTQKNRHRCGHHRHIGESNETKFDLKNHHSLRSDAYRLPPSLTAPMPAS